MGASYRLGARVVPVSWFAQSIFAVMASQLSHLKPHGKDGADDEETLAQFLLTSLAEVKSCILLVDFMEENPDDVDIFVTMIINILDALQ